MTSNVCRAVEVQQGTEAWHAFRSQHLGGSDAPIIAGESPYSSPFALWAERTQGVERPQDQTRELLFRLGHHMEPLILSLYAEETGREVRPGRVVESIAYPFLSASLDGETDGRVVEAKWTTSRRWDDGVPPDVLIQVQHEMGVSGYPVADVAVLTGRSFRIHEVAFDPDLWEDIRRLEVRFWEENIVGGIPPEVSGSDADREALTGLYPRETDEMIQDDPAIGLMVRELLAARKREEEIAREVGSLENALRFALAAHDGAEGPGFRVTYRRVKDSTRVDWQAYAHRLEALVPQDQAGSLAVAMVESSKVVEGTRRLYVRGQEVEG